MVKASCGRDGSSWCKRTWQLRLALRWKRSDSTLNLCRTPQVLTDLMIMLLTEDISNDLYMASIAGLGLGLYSHNVRNNTSMSHKYIEHDEYV